MAHKHGAQRQADNCTATVLLIFGLTLLLEDTAGLVTLPLELFASVVPLLELE